MKEIKTVIEKHTYEQQQHSVEVAPAPAVREHVEERTITKEPPTVRRRTDAVTTTRTHNDDNDNDDND